VHEAFSALPVRLRHTQKGALVATWAGRAAACPRGLTAHVDTLGAMVKEIKTNGRLHLTQIGGYAWQSVEGEGCTVFAAGGTTLRGTIQLVKPSVHVHGPATRELERKEDTMEVRLDARVTSADDTRALGIEVGDCVALDPRVEVTDSGFVRSRHLDDKAGVACIYAAFLALAEAGRVPAQTTTALISNFEEVGHGATAGWPPDLREVVVVDMAAVGEGQNSDEYSVGLCVKDSGGPYSASLTRTLQTLARQNHIAVKPDVYPYYGSDGGALWRTGADVSIGLIGPGVEASHSYERTHTDSLVATASLITAWLLA
jgi:putative aminopeptidase FrvX